MLRNGATLVSRYRDLHELSLKLREQLQPLVEDAKSLPEIPELDTDLLEAIEQPADKNLCSKRCPLTAARPLLNTAQPLQGSRGGGGLGGVFVVR